MAAIPTEIQERLQHHLTAIARLFKAPRITVIVRGPEVGNAKGDRVLSNDNLTHALAALRARMVAEAKFLDGQFDVIEVEATAPAHGIVMDEINPLTVPSGNNLKRATS